MSREKDLAVNTVILTVGKICTQFVSYLLLPLYTALLLPEEYGIVDLFSTYISLLVPLFNWQFENGFFRFMLDCRENKEKQTALFTTVFVSHFWQALLFCVCYFAVQSFIPSEYKLFLLINVLLNIFMNTLMQLPRGLGNNTVYAVASFISAISTVLANILFIAVFRWGAYGMFVANIVGKCITIVYLILSQKVWSFFKISKYDKSLFKEVSRYSLPLIPNQLSWWVVGVSDRTIISYVVGVAANGIYSMANKFSTLFIVFYNIFNMSWTESVSLHMNDEDRDDYLTKTINTMFRLFAAIGIGIIACMPFVFPIMINEKYNDAYYQIPILMVAVLFQVVVGLYSVIYVALKKSTEIAKTSFWAAIINIVVNLLFVNYFGLYAASFSTLAAYATMAIYRYYDIKKYVNVVLDRKTLVITVIVGAITICSYYYNQLFTNVLTLIMVVVFAMLTNKEFLLSSWEMVVGKLKKKR
ncbi:MAG: lipopolysaccharide biosynthesis protein [Lachnospiraceae bacterium]|nr:lipopolysaccharide biosynthesis protein [Lachnospiraceae bacterium]